MRFGSSLPGKQYESGGARLPGAEPATPGRIVRLPSKAPPAPVASARPRPWKPLLRRLGLFGLDEIEPVLLAALVTEEPLLLIGPHGTGKSLLLTRLGEALGLLSRHYNASLLNFDDLLGFPLPREDGQLQYVETPASIWGAGAVIFDEINRCRPDMANRLFPIIHEKRAQGIRLTDLRYRWAAMNPPRDDEGEDDDPYVGTRPLDAALADRFAFVVTMPGWGDYSEADRLAIVGAEEASVAPEAGDAVRREVLALRERYQVIRRRRDALVSSYVATLVSLLLRRKTVLSPRRSGMLRRAIFAIRAADSRYDPASRLEQSAFKAVRFGLPQAALGAPVPVSILRLAHKEAWIGAQETTPAGALLACLDPVKRVARAIAEPELGGPEFTTTVSEALAEAPPGAREAIAVHLFESAAASRLHASVAGEAAVLCRDAILRPKTGIEIPVSRWRGVKDALAGLDPRDPRDRLIANSLARRCRDGNLEGSAPGFLASWKSAERVLGPTEKASPEDIATSRERRRLPARRTA